ncbi:MAG: glycosyltransferase [Bacteroidaceae bacterium]|nr:glycosyltransferase [Bacteroidaceae bacterium]
MLLYLGEIINKVRSGGDAINLRNIKLLKQFYRKDFYIKDIACTSKYSTFFNLIFGYMNGLTLKNVSQIIKSISKNKNCIVFLSSSKMGKIASIIKKNYPQVKIIIFFHNIEKQYTKEEYRINPTLKNWFISKVTAYNEKLSCQYGDILIVLNNRDKELLYKYYNRKADLLLPTSFEDKYDKKKASIIHKEKLLFTLLFVGNAFFANIEAINWFLSNVFPQLANCQLIIVGNGMDKKISSTNKNIKIIGYVDDLSIYYYKCNVVISPIFSGGGMKTKTAEALMYGCPIIGTNEAFEGYDIDIKSIGACCNDATSMVYAIKELQENPLMLNNKSISARKIFKELYTLDASIELFKQIKL